jgi:hypothetical protein
MGSRAAVFTVEPLAIPFEGFHGRLEVLRRRAHENARHVPRLGQLVPERVEREPLDGGRSRPRGTRAVQGIDRQRVTRGPGVHADLVRSTRERPRADQREAPEAFENLELGEGGALGAWSSLAGRLYASFFGRGGQS